MRIKSELFIAIIKYSEKRQKTISMENEKKKEIKKTQDRSIPSTHPLHIFGDFSYYQL